MMVDKKKDAVDQKVEAEVANILEQELTQPYHSPVAPAKDIYQQAAEAIATFKVKGYEDLERILTLAYEQSAKGKGKERHSTGPMGFKSWDRQPILEISRMVGPGYAAGQIQKKVQEAVTMAGNIEKLDAAMHEALGAIVYGAALYKIFEEIKAARRY